MIENLYPGVGIVRYLDGVFFFFLFGFGLKERGWVFCKEFYVVLMVA